MGLFDLAGKAIGGAINFGVEVGKEAYAANVDYKIQEETKNALERVSMELERVQERWLSGAKQIQYSREKELFQKGLLESFDRITNCYHSVKYAKIYFTNHLKNGKDLSELESYVQEVYDTYVNSEAFPYKEKASQEYNLLFKQLHETWAEEIKEKICGKIRKSEHQNKDGSSFKGILFDLSECIYLLYVLKMITNDEKYQLVINSLDEFIKDGKHLFSTLHEIEYGEFDAEPEKYWFSKEVPFDINIVEKYIQNALEHAADNETGYFEGITTHLKMPLLVDTSIRLWYYARLTPFDQFKFNSAVESRNHFSGDKDNDFEVILAELYVKNQLGGSALVLQNLDEIMSQADIRNPIYARGLCSFLAWMECYDIELEVLKRTIANKIQLTEEMQKRLAFLADGGKAASVKVYDIGDSSDFCFDTHSLEWGNTEFDTLFRKLKSKNKRLDYALVTKGWHKPYPIQRGMKFSMDSLEKEFDRLVADFDGEVVMEKNGAHALNLNNMAYPEAYLFKFTSERNRGLTVLFECEKFGRSLQLNILVSFMPDDKMNPDDMLQYALAVQGSSYVKSFLESILQAIDASLTAKSSSIYD